MLQLRPLAPGFGLEAIGADLSRPLTDGDFREIEATFYEGQVLVLRGQTLTPGEFVAFARRFGPPEPHVIDHAEGTRARGTGGGDSRDGVRRRKHVTPPPARE